MSDVSFPPIEVPERAYGGMEEPDDSLGGPVELSEDIEPDEDEYQDEPRAQNPDNVETVAAILSGLVTERAATILASVRNKPGLWSAEASPIDTWATQDDYVRRSTQTLRARYRDHAARRASAASKQRFKLAMQEEYRQTDQKVIPSLSPDLGDWRQYTEVHYFKAESKRDRVVTLDPGGYLVKGGRRLPDGTYGWVLSYAEQELFVFDADIYTQVKFEYDKNLQRLTDKVEKLAEKQPNPAAIQQARLTGYQAIRHPSHVAGEAVYGAGLLSIQGGLIKRLDDESGHYRPLLQNTGAAAAILRSRNFFADGARVELIGAKTERGRAKGYLPANAPRMSLLLDQLDVLVQAEASERDARKKRAFVAKLTKELGTLKEKYEQYALEAEGTAEEGTAELWPRAMGLAQDAVDALSEGEIVTDEGKRAVTLVAETAGLQVGTSESSSAASGDEALSSSLADDDEDADDAESSSSEEGSGGTGGAPASAPVTLADVDLARVDKRNRDNLKALTDRGQISFIQSADGLVLIGDGHDWTAVRYMGEAGQASGTLRIRKGGFTSAGALVVTNASDTEAFTAAIARISDKTCVFQ